MFDMFTRMHVSTNVYTTLTRAHTYVLLCIMALDLPMRCDAMKESDGADAMRYDCASTLADAMRCDEIASCFLPIRCDAIKSWHQAIRYDAMGEVQGLRR